MILFNNVLSDCKALMVTIDFYKQQCISKTRLLDIQQIPKAQKLEKGPPKRIPERLSYKTIIIFFFMFLLNIACELHF